MIINISEQSALILWCLTVFFGGCERNSYQKNVFRHYVV